MRPVFSVEREGVVIDYFGMPGEPLIPTVLVRCQPMTGLNNFHISIDAAWDNPLTGEKSQYEVDQRILEPSSQGYCIRCQVVNFEEGNSNVMVVIPTGERFGLGPRVPVDRSQLVSKSQVNA